MCLISCSAKSIGDLTLWGRNHLLYLEKVRPVGVPNGGRPPQNPRVDASWEVIAADALCCSGSADFPVVFPRELCFSRFFPWELQKPISLIEISLNYFPPDNQPLSVESAPGRGRSDHGEVSRPDGCPPSLQACCRRSWLVCDGAPKPRPAIPCG